MKVSISGIRGEFGTDLTINYVSMLTRSFAATLIDNGGSCVVSRDTRPSGRTLTFVTIAALLEQGVQVYDLGIAPTPAVFRESRRYRGGIVITASHNPNEWNGLKFILNGKGISEGDLGTVLASKAYGMKDRGALYRGTSNYVSDVLEFMHHRRQSHKTRIGLDPGGGAACGYVNELFRELGHRHLAINDTRGISSRGTDPTLDDLNELRSLVTGSALALGFAFDLDGDRVVVVDKDGRKMESDATLLLCIGAAIDHGAKRFVVSLDTSLALENIIRKAGGKLQYSKVGEANVVGKMLETGADAGGEGSSAGFISPNFNMCRDGLLASALISSLGEKEQKEYLDFIQRYEQKRSVVSVPDSLKTKIIDELVEPLGRMATETFLDDGIKALLDENSWILVRPSNTEDTMRISVESTRGNAHHLFKFVKQKVLETNESVKRRANN